MTNKHIKDVWYLFKRLNVEFSDSLATSLLGTCPKELKTGTKKTITYVLMSTAELFKTA